MSTFWIIVISAIIGAIVGVIVLLITDYLKEE